MNLLHAQTWEAPPPKEISFKVDEFAHDIFLSLQFRTSSSSTFWEEEEASKIANSVQ